MPAAAPTSLDLSPLKARQQAMWGSGDYSAVAARIAPISELLCDTADLRAGDRVLDVATGSGSTAIAAARCGCDVVGIDYVDSLLQRARVRADAEGFHEAEFLLADAEDLPFDDAEFDAVVSVVGVMFAPDQERAAGELLRVTRPGGTIAVANWTPDGFVGDMLKVVKAYAPPPPGLRSPVEWGTEARVRELLGDGVSEVRIVPRHFTFRFRSAEALADFFLVTYGPTERASAGLEQTGREALRADLVDLARRSDRLADAEATAVDAAYIEVVATRA